MNYGNNTKELALDFLWEGTTQDSKESREIQKLGT
jgi:hypothetical protein